VLVEDSEQNDQFTLSEFSKRFEAITGVPASNQRLIYKGKSLTDMTLLFSSIGFTNNSKLMLLGKKFSVDDEAHITKMCDVESSVTATENKLNDLTTRLADIQRGFLAAELQEEGLVKLSRQVLACIEALSVQLERLDALCLSQSSSDVQNKRKTIVRRIQELLERADGLHSDSNDTLVKLNL